MSSSGVGQRDVEKGGTGKKKVGKGWEKGEKGWRDGLTDDTPTRRGEESFPLKPIEVRMSWVKKGTKLCI